MEAFLPVHAILLSCSACSACSGSPAPGRPGPPGARPPAVPRPPGAERRANPGDQGSAARAGAPLLLLLGQPANPASRSVDRHGLQLRGDLFGLSPDSLAEIVHRAEIVRAYSVE